jgi:hypothetical protein
MAQMTDPSSALKSFQERLVQGSLPLQRGDIDPNLYLHVDHPNGKPRFTYVTLTSLTVTAFVSFVMCDAIQGILCFNIGYAVPALFRNQGRATSIIRSAILEMKNGFSRAGITTFYIEAIVGKDNISSQQVAQKTITEKPIEIIDQVSGLPALQYICKI